MRGRGERTQTRDGGELEGGEHHIGEGSNELVTGEGVTGDDRGEEVCSSREDSCWMTKERE